MRYGLSKKIIGLLSVLCIVVQVAAFHCTANADNEQTDALIIDSESENTQTTNIIQKTEGDREFWSIPSSTTGYMYPSELKRSKVDIISADFRVSDKNIHSYLEILDADAPDSAANSDKYRRTLYFNKDKLMFFRTDMYGGGGCQIGDIDPGVWHHFDICVDYEKRKVYYYIDGEIPKYSTEYDRFEPYIERVQWTGKFSAIKDIPEKFNAAKGLRLVNEVSDSGSTVDFDNLKMYSLMNYGEPVEFDESVNYPEYIASYVSLSNDVLGSNFFGGDISYNMTITNPYDKESEFSYKVKITDNDGAVEKESEDKVKLAAGESKTIPLSYKIDGYGFYKIITETTDSLYGRLNTTENDFASIVKNDELNYQSALCSHMTSGHGMARADELVPMLANAGFSGLRDGGMDWRSVEPQKGAYVFPKKAEYIGELSAKENMHNLWLIAYDNPAVVPGWTPISESHINAFAEYAYQTAKIAKDNGIDAEFEIWNEYNHIPFNHDEGTVQDYINMLKTVHSAIKRANPDAKIWGMGGITYIGNYYDWIEEFLKLGGQKYCDGLSIHPYTPTKTAKDSYDVFEKTKELFEKYGCSDMPICISEVGWTLDGLGNGVQQGDNTVQFSALTIDEVERNFFYVAQMKEQSSESENSFGMIRQWDPTAAYPYEAYAAKPVFVGMANYNKLMNKASQKQKIDCGGSGVEAYKYKAGDGESIVVAWSSGANAKDAIFKTNGETAKIYDIYGNCVESNCVDGKIQLILDESPKYIKGDFSEVEYSEDKLFGLSTKEVDTPVNDSFSVQITKTVDYDIMLDAKTPENIKLVENTGFNGGKTATLVFSTGDKATENTSITVFVKKDDGVCGELTLPINYVETISYKVLASYFRAGRWQYMINLTNNKFGNSISGSIKVSGVDKVIRFEDIQPLNNKKIYINIPDDVLDVKTHFNAEIELDNGEKFSMDTDVYTSGIVYTEKEPTIDGYLDDWNKETPFRLKYPSQVNKIDPWEGVEDVGGNVYCMYNKDYFYIAAEITDNVLGDNDEQKRIWANDSIQFAFAPVNVKGKPITEYGIGLVNGEPKTERYSYVAVDTGIIGVNDKYDFSVIELKIRRNEDKKITYYEAKFPWLQIYGEGFNPDKHDSLYMSMLLNDNDLKGRRGWLEYCPGIGGAKDASQFNDTPLVKKSTFRYND